MLGFCHKSVSTPSCLQQACLPTAIRSVASIRTAMHAIPNSHGSTASVCHSVELSRRGAINAAIVASFAGFLAGPSIAWPARSEGAPGPFKKLHDDILAYEFLYPVETQSGKLLHLRLARTPEKYSSAAPLTADARQRIVSELLDLENYISVSVSVGPVSGVLKGTDPSLWRARDVALTVLTDRSTSRLTSGQRTTLNDVEDVAAEDRDGQTYWLYEHLSQGSPTLKDRDKETYRHALAVTSIRPGLDSTPFLYTLNLACPQSLWEDLAPYFRTSAESFALLPTSSSYIPPDKDPWLFF